MVTPEGQGKDVIIKSAISKDKAELMNDYFLKKRDISVFLYRNNVPDSCYGRFGDELFSGTYNMYGDPLSDLILEQMKPIIEIGFGIKLVPSYSYMRVYERGDELLPHIDRELCKFSATMNLGGDLWPIFVEGEETLLTPGDLLLYYGCDQWHWRLPLEGEQCSQMFLHYTALSDKVEDKFDGRPILGIPRNFLDGVNITNPQ